MEKYQSSGTARAHLELNSKMDGGKSHASIIGTTEAESANLKMDEQFRGDSSDQPAEDVSPAFIYNPTIRMNPEDRK
ncbi:MAG: hypothetical protein Q8898_09375 [Bacillota bacterium]|nr:hypothetical protein [Bacillota bacterium]